MTRRILSSELFEDARVRPASYCTSVMYSRFTGAGSEPLLIEIRAYCGVARATGQVDTGEQSTGGGVET